MISFSKNTGEIAFFRSSGQARGSLTNMLQLVYAYGIGTTWADAVAMSLSFLDEVQLLRPDIAYDTKQAGVPLKVNFGFQADKITSPASGLVNNMVVGADIAIGSFRNHFNPLYYGIIPANMMTSEVAALAGAWISSVGNGTFLWSYTPADNISLTTLYGCYSAKFACFAKNGLAGWLGGNYPGNGSAANYTTDSAITNFPDVGPGIYIFDPQNLDPKIFNGAPGHPTADFFANGKNIVPFYL